MNMLCAMNPIIAQGFAVLYSPEQKCWHIEQLWEYFNQNQRRIRNLTETSEWILIWVSPTREDARNVADHWKEIFKTELGTANP
jgi:hypothetical protein